MFAAKAFEVSDSSAMPAIVDDVIRKMGLEVCAETRCSGLSGGQKRRVKCLEMAVGNAAWLTLLDEITNGLDSASALQICQVVKVVTQVFQTHAMTSLLQPSQAVFDTFDSLCNAANAFIDQVLILIFVYREERSIGSNSTIAEVHQLERQKPMQLPYNQSQP